MQSGPIILYLDSNIMVKCTISKFRKTCNCIKVKDE